MSRGWSPNKILVLDANIWIKGMFNFNQKANWIIKSCLSGKFKIVINSYVVAEITRVLKRVAIRLKINPLDIEKEFWIIINSNNIIKDFVNPISESLIDLLKSRDEIMLISKTFGLEPKDVPYLVLAFKFKATIVTEDIRSVYAKRKEIFEKLEVKVVSLNELKI